MKFQDGEKVLFIGDSVTDADRKRPLGQGLWEGTGKGFVRMIENFINVGYPQRFIHIVNMGSSGDTTVDIVSRFDTDCLALKPNYAVICIGFNDVWRFFDEPTLREGHVSLETYAENLRLMVEKCKNAGIECILMSPYYMETNKADLMRAKMDEYRFAMQEVAKEKGVKYIDLQVPFDEYLKYRYPAYISWDRIHPGNVGALIIAKTFLKHIGFDFNLL